MALRRLCGPDGRGGRQMSVQHSAAGPEFNHTRDQPDTQVLNAAGFSAAESAAMDSALAAAAQGPRGANPLVGAVVIGTDGTPLVTGYHRGAGTAHAEADAIAQAAAAGLDLTGTTMVVTLEPCNHCGRTGPCAQAIIDAGVADVVYAIDDPHDPAAGGAATLRAAGVRVRSGLGAVAALDLNRRWFDADAAVNGGDGRVLHLPTREPREALDRLFDAGVRHLMVEGGSRILSAFLAAGLVDELIVYLAPTLLGSGTLALDDLGIGTLADAQHWDWDGASGGAVRMLGRDLRLHLRPATNTSSDSTPRSDADTAAGGN